jgi:hypothetical protein
MFIFLWCIDFFFQFDPYSFNYLLFYWTFYKSFIVFNFTLQSKLIVFFFFCLLFRFSFPFVNVFILYTLTFKIKICCCPLIYFFSYILTLILLIAIFFGFFFIFFSNHLSMFHFLWIRLHDFFFHK